MNLTKNLLTLALLTFFAVSCGKHELPNNVLNELNRVSERIGNELEKAVDDVESETSRVNKRLGAELTRWKKSSDINIHYAVKDLGENIENVGQFPRDIINKALGTSQDTNEKQDELFDRVDEIERQLEALRADLNAKEASLAQSIDNLSNELRGADSDLLDEINSKYQSLRTLIRSGQFRDMLVLMYLIDKTNQLQNDINYIAAHVDSLEVVCYNADLLGVIMLEFYCQLED